MSPKKNDKKKPKSVKPKAKRGKPEDRPEEKKEKKTAKANKRVEKTTKKEIDYVTTSDYIWRWDTDWFWCSKHFLVQNPLVRFFWPQQKLRSTTYWKIRKWAHDSTLAKALLVFQKKQESIVQDVEVPIDHAPEFIEFFHKEMERPI